MATWFEEYVCEPLKVLLASVAVGQDVRDLEQAEVRKLGSAVEGMFRSHAHEYQAWPRESTTDGSGVDLCVRTGEDTLDVVGLTWIDFSGERFPFRAEIVRTGERHARVTMYIGQVDPRSGQPPRLPRGTMILPERDEDGLNAVAELLLGHQPTPITWTQAFEVS